MAERSSLCVVIASKVGAPFIDQCLASLKDQVQHEGADVIVVACGKEDAAQRLSRDFPWVRVIHEPEWMGVPKLRRRGVDATQADIVAIIEEHCVADPHWLSEARKAFEENPSAVAVGGPVADRDYKRLRDWVVYFMEYNGSMPPAPDGPTGNLNGANIAYRRDVLASHRDLLDQGYWEANLHPVLLASGKLLQSAPRMVVHHCGPFELKYYLGQRFLFSRAYAGARAQTLPITKRLAYLVLAPVVPVLLFGRMASRVWKKRCRIDKFIQTLPLFVPALGSMVAGEWLGYAFGPGNALSKVE